MTLTANQIELILDEAHGAAEECGLRIITARKAAKPETHPDNWGACGFAWVKIGGRGAFAMHCKRKANLLAQNFGTLKRYGNMGYPHGWEFWAPGYDGQNIDAKEECARAFADVLIKHGFDAHVGSRLD